jgi:hypothetical protein
MVLKRILKGVLVGALCLQFNLVGGISFLSPECYVHSIDTFIQAKVSLKKILENYFTSKGFITGNIKIPELGVEIPLKKNQFYKKEEDVLDILKRINEIRSEFRLLIPVPDIIDPCGWCGEIVAKCSEEKAVGYIVLIKGNLNDASKICTTGHENGHFLWYIGKQELIYQKFKSPDLIKSRINDDSPFAILCGWIAMKKAGYYLNDCLIINSKNPETEKKSDFIKNLVRDYLKDKN